MNFKQLLFLLSLAFIFVSCANDEDILCTQSDWVGTYTGSVVCGAVTEDAIISITASGATAIIVSYEDAVGSPRTYDPITPINCDLIQEDMDSIFSLSIDGILDGDNLVITETWSTLGQTGTCIIEGVRN